MKNVNTGTKNEGIQDERKRTPFATKALLTAAVVAGIASCTPDVTNKIYFTASDAGATDAEKECTTITKCAAKTVELRESGNTAGPSTKKVGDAKVTLVEVVDQENTKAATIEMTGCKKNAVATLVSGQTSSVGLGNDSFEVTNDAIVYDASGVLVKVTVKPACEAPKETGDKDAGAKDAETDDSGK